MKINIAEDAERRFSRMDIEDEIDELEQAIASIEDAIASLDAYKIDYADQLLETKIQMENQLEPLRKIQQEQWDKEVQELEYEYEREAI